MNAVAFFNSARALKRELTGNPGATLSQEDVDLLNSATAARWRPIAAPAVSDSLPAPSRTSERLTASNNRKG